MYRIIHLFPHLKNLYLNGVPLKNWNQRVDTGGGGKGLIRGGPIREVTQVGKRGLICRGDYMRGGGIIGEEIWY